MAVFGRREDVLYSVERPGTRRDEMRGPTANPKLAERTASAKLAALHMRVRRKESNIERRLLLPLPHPTHPHLSNRTTGTAAAHAAEAESRPKSVHRYNVAEQQVIYKSEIERIWKAQFDSLSRKDEPQLTEEKEEKVPRGRQASVRQKTVPPKASPGAGPSSPASPAFSRGSSLDWDRDTSLGTRSSRPFRKSHAKYWTGVL
ncbi:hypothetical protein B0H14DRAFT_2612187 [Mycena olivaceomarginata]|nr:hypothetical protein B0H14DRAFT_2612187 [Mycena olivaceomarginata]